MKYKTQTGQSIESAFRKFHRDNPQVYQVFKEQCYRAIRRKRTRISSKMIINWIRWEVALDIKTKENFKINDAFTSRYARLYVKQHPEHIDLFEFRELRDGSEKAKPENENPFERDVARLLMKGGEILHYTSNNTWVAVQKRPKKSIPLTELFVRKLLKSKRSLKKVDSDMFTDHYAIVTKKIKK